MIFEQMAKREHEQMLFFHDASTGLRAIVCIHDGRFRHALGGIRFRRYTDEKAAINDALRLAEGMALKFAALRLRYGGAKGIVLEHDGIPDRAAMFERLGVFIDRLGGRFQTGEDMGTTPADMASIRRRTRYVWGAPGESGGHGDPSPYTAAGVLRSIEAVVLGEWGRHSLAGLHVALQGCGNVGAALGDRLVAAGARLTVSDTSPERAARAGQRWSASVVEPDAIYDTPCDVFAPCAIGGILTGSTIARLQCRLVVGGANNQLAEEHDAEALHQRDIVYVPDFVANAGGVLFLTTDLRGVARTAISAEIEAIGDRVAALVKASRTHGRPANQVALEEARAWLASEHTAGVEGELSGQG